MARFVGRHRHHSFDVGKSRVGPCGERLLDQVDAKAGEFRNMALQRRRRPRLVRVHDEARARGPRPYRRNALRHLFAVQLDLEERTVRMAGGGRAHRVGLIEAQGVCGDQGDGESGARCGRFPRPPPAALRFQVPQGAVDGVAGRTRAHRFRELPAFEPFLEVSAQSFDRLHHAVHALAVAAVRDALPSADGAAAVAKLHEDRVGHAARPARDAKDLRERP